ncbi:MAG TPA: glutaredoxin family protein [Pyrinomonadaceae bacterium]|jgi:glutaredoxin
MTAGKTEVMLYTRPGCHLCAEARREMLAAGGAADYNLVEVNIDADPALAARYGWDIPVVAINGVVVFKHRLRAADFRRELKRLTEKST